MSADIETVNGTSFFATALVPAWHRLGTVVDHTMTATEVLTEAHLAGWNVRKMPLLVNFNDEESLFGIENKTVGRYEAVVRDNPVTFDADILGVVGTQYTPFQNEDLVQLLDAVVGESGANYETAGSLNDGRRVFVSMKLPRTMTLTNKKTDDDTDFFITVTNSHDGTSSLTMMVTPIRVVCANTLALALQYNRGIIRVRHTKNMRVTIDEVRKDLDLVSSYIDEFEDQAQRMIQRQMDEDEIRAKFEEIYKSADADISERARTVRTAHVDSVMSVYQNAETLNGMRGTGWGGFNAVTEYLDHHIKSQNGDEGRATRALFSNDVQAIRSRAAEVFARA